MRCDAKDNLVKCLVETPIDFAIVKDSCISKKQTATSSWGLGYNGYIPKILKTYVHQPMVTYCFKLDVCIE